jgi:hypothetical protein
MKKQKPKFITAGGNGATNVNQHAPKFADKRTKRNRDRASQKRNAISDSQN